MTCVVAVVVVVVVEEPPTCCAVKVNGNIDLSSDAVVEDDAEQGKVKCVAMSFVQKDWSDGWMRVLRLEVLPLLAVCDDRSVLEGKRYNNRSYKSERRQGSA